MTQPKLPSRILGYAWSSDDPADLERQVRALHDAGCLRVFREISDAGPDDRAELDRVILALRPKDILIVTRLDRLTRSTLGLLKILGETIDAGAGFRSLAEAWADIPPTRASHRLAGLLDGLARFDREILQTRTREGRERAAARGATLGRKPSLTPRQQRDAIARRRKGETLTAIAESLGVSHSTISRLTADVPVPAKRKKRKTRRRATPRLRREPLALSRRDVVLPDTFGPFSHGYLLKKGDGPAALYFSKVEADGHLWYPDTWRAQVSVI